MDVKLCTQVLQTEFHFKFLISIDELGAAYTKHFTRGNPQAEVSRNFVTVGCCAGSCCMTEKWNLCQTFHIYHSTTLQQLKVTCMKLSASG